MHVNRGDAAWRGRGASRGRGVAWARSVKAPRRRSRWSWFDAIAVSSETLGAIWTGIPSTTTSFASWGGGGVSPCVIIVLDVLVVLGVMDATPT